MMEDLINLICSQDVLEIHKGVIGIRKLSRLKDPKVIGTLIKLQGVELLVELSKAKDNYPQISLEAVWALNNHVPLVAS